MTYADKIKRKVFRLKSYLYGLDQVLLQRANAGDFDFEISYNTFEFLNERDKIISDVFIPNGFYCNGGVVSWTTPDNSYKPSKFLPLADELYLIANNIRIERKIKSDIEDAIKNTIVSGNNEFTFMTRFSKLDFICSTFSELNILKLDPPNENDYDADFLKFYGYDIVVTFEIK